MLFILLFICRQELEHPLILIHDKKISDMNSLVRILELAVKVNDLFYSCNVISRQE